MIDNKELSNTLDGIRGYFGDIHMIGMQKIDGKVDSNLSDIEKELEMKRTGMTSLNFVDFMRMNFHCFSEDFLGAAEKSTSESIEPSSVKERLDQMVAVAHCEVVMRECIHRLRELRKASIKKFMKPVDDIQYMSSEQINAYPIMVLGELNQNVDNVLDSVRDLSSESILMLERILISFKERFKTSQSEKLLQKGLFQEQEELSWSIEELSKGVNKIKTEMNIHSAIGTK